MSSSAVGLQVDLPGLSSLFLNLGAAGLKKIAQAGVDLHTLLYIGEIAEMCPACLEYRKEINTCRQNQRKETIWLYKLVEIGTASNFIADELLKRRAGENIVALMSTILPILSEEECDSFILKLFEECKIDVDKTPGLAQLQALRDAILPLAQILDFKDRTYQYHVLLDQLQSQDPRPLRKSIPSVETLVQVVLMLQKLAMHTDAAYKIIYRGWEGAAWVIAYARHVLGLSVCVLRTAQDSVPINGDYKSSRVFVYIFESERSCELVVDGNFTELITPMESSECTPCAIDLTNVNLRTIYVPDSPHLREAASVITRSLVQSFASRRARGLGYESLRWQRTNLEEAPMFTPYAVHCLPFIRRRALKIIGIMGFRVQEEIEPGAHAWQEYLLLHKPKAGFSLYPGPAWMDSSHVCQHLTQKGKSILRFNKSGKLLLQRIIRIADVASCLAFSNWGEKVRLISTRFLEDGLPDAHALCSLGEERWSAQSLFEEDYSSNINSINELTCALVYIVIGEKLDLKQHLNPESLAFETHNVVFARAAATEDSLKFDAVLIHIHPGHISILGQRRMEIRSYYDTDIVWDHDIELPASHDPQPVVLAPFDGIRGSEIRSTLKLHRSYVEVTRALVVDSHIFNLHCPSLFNNEIFCVYVASSCSHAYDSPAHVALDCEYNIRSGFTNNVLGDAELNIFLQAVDQNSCGQWASVYGGIPKNFIELQIGYRVMDNFNRILQQTMCTKCIIDHIVKCHKSRDRSEEDWKPRFCFSVIPFRPSSEVVDEARGAEVVRE